MKRHKLKDHSGNKIFYIHVASVHTPLQSVEECFSVKGPDSKEDFEDFRYENWDEQMKNLNSGKNEGLMDINSLVALTRYEAERLHSLLERMLSE